MATATGISLRLVQRIWAAHGHANESNGLSPVPALAALRTWQNWLGQRQQPGTMQAKPLTQSS
jgi:hypothetical protein